MDRGKEGSLQHNIYEYSGFSWMAFSHKGVWLAQITRDVHVLPADRSLLLYAARDSYPPACTILVCYYAALCRYLIWFFVFANYRFGWSGDISTVLLIIVFFYGPVSLQLPNPPIVPISRSHWRSWRSRCRSTRPSCPQTSTSPARASSSSMSRPNSLWPARLPRCPSTLPSWCRWDHFSPRVSGLGSRVCVVAVMGN